MRILTIFFRVILIVVTPSTYWDEEGRKRDEPGHALYRH